MSEDNLSKYREGLILGVKFRRLGVENWTEADFLEDARRRKLNSEANEARKKALIDRGWELHFKYCSCHEGGEYAIDPVTKESVSHAEAYARQEQREPGSVPPWPVFDNDWKPPPSTEGLFNIQGKTELSAIVPKRFDLIERRTRNIEAMWAAEDAAVFEALDKIENKENTP